jgi:hypothetical protein
MSLTVNRTVNQILVGWLLVVIGTDWDHHVVACIALFAAAIGMAPARHWVVLRVAWFVRSDPKEPVLACV